MEIVTAGPSDINLIGIIDETVIGNDSRRGYLAKSVIDGKCIIAKINNTIVGFIVYDTTFYGNTFIWLVMVSPSFRRQGVAKALIRHLQAICPTDKLFTSTNESNAVMKRLCDSLGFIQSGWIENLDEGDPEVVFFKRVR